MTLIYLADLTHTTITVSSDSFPLGAGMVGAYVKKQFPDVEIQLFKYPDDLLAALKRQQPDMLGLSNYPWNLSLGSAFFKYVKEQNPKTITVMGGPNMPYGPSDQQRLLNKIGPALDFYCLYEGETAFVEVLKSAFDKDFNIAAMKADQPAGTIYMHNGELVSYKAIPRMKDLDIYPSPYQTGIFDKFFDGVLSPMIETHRGCPFRCTYCHEGHESYTKINRFSSERIKNDIRYIASHVGDKVANFLIADPNFGVFPRDVEFAAEMAATHKEYGYPKTIFATTAKNVNDRIIEISKTLGDVAMPIWMSVQSLTEAVLENIKRRNINISTMIEVQQRLAEIQSTTKSELILSLPGETLETHIQSLVKLIKLHIDQIVCYQLMIVNGSEMMADVMANRDPALKSGFRIIPRSFTEIDGPGRAIEVEEIVVGTKDLPYEDYLKARQMHILISIFYNGKAFKGFFNLLEEWNLDLEAFLFNLLDAFVESKAFAKFNENFIEETHNELFDSEEELRAYFAQDEHFNHLYDGTRGGNLLQKYTSFAYMHHAGDLVDLISDSLVKVGPNSQKFMDQASDLRKYYALLFAEFLSPERDAITTSDTFKYNIMDWLEQGGSLEGFEEKESVEFIFTTPPEQFKLVEGHLDRLGRNEQAFGKIMTRLWIYEMFRHPSRVAAE